MRYVKSLIDEGYIGTAVNIAARLETLAAPGGICISESVHQHVANRLQLDYVDLGRQALKNIAQPLRVFSIGGTGAEGVISSAMELQAPQSGQRPSHLGAWYPQF